MHFYLNNWCDCGVNFAISSRFQASPTGDVLQTAHRTEAMSPMVRYRMRRPEVLSMLGVPAEQIAQMKQDG
jgi:hypothetical protein